MSILTNATEVLRLFSRDCPELTVTEVAQRLGIPKSSASRLLKSMHQAGFLARTGAVPRYQVGDLILEVTRFHRMNSSLIARTVDAVTAISEETGHAGYVSVLDGADIIVVRPIPGRHFLRVVTPTGTRMPAFGTAIGRALLARLDDDQVRALHPPRLPAAPKSPQTVVDLLRRLEEVRRCGWSEAVNETIPGVGSVAVCVTDPATLETIGMCVSYSAPMVTPVERQRIIHLLVTAARTIARTVGDEYWMSIKPEPHKEAAASA